MAPRKDAPADDTPDAGTIPIEQAARLLMISAERVRQLIKLGFIPRPKPGRTTLVGAVQGYIKFRDDADRRASKSATATRASEARTEEIQMRIAEKRRELVPLDDAVAALDIVVGKVKEELSGMPARLTRDIELRRKIEAELNGAQKRIAEGLTTSAKFLREGGELPYSVGDNDA